MAAIFFALCLDYDFHPSLLSICARFAGGSQPSHYWSWISITGIIITLRPLINNFKKRMMLLLCSTSIYITICN
jgi:hypothetical protein